MAVGVRPPQERLCTESGKEAAKFLWETFRLGLAESREVTLKNARFKIVALARQLRLRPDHVDMSFYFYKLPLSSIWPGAGRVPT